MRERFLEFVVAWPGAVGIGAALLVVAALHGALGLAQRVLGREDARD